MSTQPDHELLFAADCPVCGRSGTVVTPDYCSDGHERRVPRPHLPRLRQCADQSHSPPVAGGRGRVVQPDRLMPGPLSPVGATVGTEVRPVSDESDQAATTAEEARPEIFRAAVASLTEHGRAPRGARRAAAAAATAGALELRDLRRRPRRRRRGAGDRTAGAAARPRRRRGMGRRAAPGRVRLGRTGRRRWASTRCCRRSAGAGSTGALDERGAAYRAAGGTVTQTTSTRFGDLAGPHHDRRARAARAAGRPTPPTSRRTCARFVDMLCLAAGLPAGRRDATARQRERSDRRERHGTRCRRSSPLRCCAEPADGVPEPLTDAERAGRARRGDGAPRTGPVALDAERASGYRYSQRAYLVQLRRAGAGTRADRSDRAARR